MVSYLITLARGRGNLLSRRRNDQLIQFLGFDDSGTDTLGLTSPAQEIATPRVRFSKVEDREAGLAMTIQIGGARNAV